MMIPAQQQRVWAEARSAFRSKMRGVCPRRARDGWRALPERMGAVEEAQLIITPIISQEGVEGGFKRRKTYAKLDGEV